MRLLSILSFQFLILFHLAAQNSPPNAPPGAATQTAPAVASPTVSNEGSSSSWAFSPDPKLPSVLIIGDSISMGYTLLVRHELQGEANVYHPMKKGLDVPANCGSTGRGLTNLDSWLGITSWQVIVFNFGLHDLEWHDASGKYVPPGQGRQSTPPDLYEKNLRQIVARLRQTGAKLIWATTTPVPANSLARAKGDEVLYNKIAANVMRENGIVIDDLCSAVASRYSELQHAPNNVHFNDEGYRVLAASVAGSIKAVLGLK